MKQTILFFLLFSLISKIGVSQNARFSQIFSAPMQINPALTGRFDGQVRVASLFSFQQSLLYNGPTYASMNHQYIAADVKLGHYRASGDDITVADTNNGKSATKEAKDVVGNNNPNGYWAVGANYYHYGHSSSPVDGSFYSVSLARHFYNRSNKFYGFGVQATYATATLDENRGLNYDIEISGGGFRYPIKTTSGIHTGSGKYLDFSVGGYYGMVTEPVMFELGAALNNFHYPKNSLVGDKESELRHRVTVNAIVRLKLNPKWGIVLKNIYWRDGLYLNSKKPDADTLYPNAFWSGVEFFKINPLSQYNINFGLYMRDFRTLAPYVNINLSKYANIRYSYEYPLNTSVAILVPYRHEVAAIFTLKRNTSPGTKFYKKLNYW